MFPLLSEIEMAGQSGKNAVADAVFDNQPRVVCGILAKRLVETPVYADRFVSHFDAIKTSNDIRFRHGGEPFAVFQTGAFWSNGSPFDACLTRAPLPKRTEAEMQLFCGKAGCVYCHSGALLSDHVFHTIGVPGSTRQVHGRIRQNRSVKMSQKPSKSEPSKCQRSSSIN